MLQIQTDWLSKWAVYSPDHLAIKELDSGRHITYGQLNHQACYLASYFEEELGIQKGDRIAILAENCIELIVLFGVAQKMGCILVPLNFRLAAGEIDYLLEQAEAKLSFVQDSFQSIFLETKNAASIQTRWSIEDLENFLAKAPVEAVSFEARPMEEDDPLMILFTSGTTGFPKGAMYTHKMVFWNSINTAMSLIINSESRTINVMPPFHTGGWNVLTTPFLHHGATVCIGRKFEPSDFLRQMQEEQVTIVFAVPTMVKMLTEEASFESASFPDLYYIIVGGEPMPIPVIEIWDKKSVPIRQGYGMTEVGPNLTSLHQRDAIRKKGSIGRPNFYVQTRIVDENGKDVATNESGELWLKGPMVTPGYWKNSEATTKAKSNGWFKTGDLVRCDEEGYLYVVDRIKNMFISGGENVYPAEVERVLIQHPAISEVVIIGVNDEKWGEVGKAFVKTHPNETLELEEMRSYCMGKLAKFKIPKHLEIVSEIPKNDTGKIDRNALNN